MTAKELIAVLGTVPEDTEICIFDMFQPQPNQFFKVVVAEEVGEQSFIDKDFKVQYGNILMLH